MRVLGLDGRVYNLRLRGARGGGSSLHLAARALLRRLFPCEPIHEEVLLPGSGRLRLDFFLPARRLAVEVQGRQHGGRVAHFHPTRLDFLHSLARDNRKREWCGLNGFALAELPWDRVDEWEGILAQGG